MRAREGKTASHWAVSWTAGLVHSGASPLLYRNISSEMLPKCEWWLPCFSIADVVCAFSTRCNLGIKCFHFRATGNMRSKAVWNLVQIINSVIKKKKEYHFSFEADPLPWQCSERGRGVEQPGNAKRISLPDELPSQRWGMQMCREHETWLPAWWFGSWCQHPCSSLCNLFLMSLRCKDWIPNLPRSECQGMCGHSRGHWDGHIFLQAYCSCSETTRTRPGKICIPLNERKRLWEELTQALMPQRELPCSTGNEVPRVTSSHS